MDYLEQIQSLDTEFIYGVNNMHSPFLDDLMVFLSHKFSAIPLYLILLFIFYKKFGLKSFLILTPIICLLITLADQGASGLAKPYFERLRPCHSLDLYLADGCGGQFGFFSSHASNTFAVAILFTLLVFKENNTAKSILILWAILVSFSRIYLGAHYLSDVLTGAVYGTMCAFFSSWLFKKMHSKFIKS